MHEAIKQATGIETANCETCHFLGDGGDGLEYNSSFPICENPKRKGADNLITFPFKAEQKCWSPHFWCSKFSKMIKTGDDKEVDQAFSCFFTAINDAQSGGQ